MMWWAIWCTLMVASGMRVVADPSMSSEAIASIPSYDLAQIDDSAPDDDDSGYGSPSLGLGRRYEPGPWVYQISEMPRDQQKASAVVRRRLKRKMPSLSISNPMEVLRQRLMLEVARKQMRQANQRQAVANRLFLQNVGKRGYWETPISSQYN